MHRNLKWRLGLCCDSLWNEGEVFHRVRAGDGVLLVDNGSSGLLGDLGPLHFRDGQVDR